MIEQIEYNDFAKIDLRIGTIIAAEVNQKARIPAYILQIDFGHENIKTSSAQITKNYQPEALVGVQVVAVMNFPAKRVAGVKSEVLILGAVDAEEDVVLLSPTKIVSNGTHIA